MQRLSLSVERSDDSLYSDWRIREAVTEVTAIDPPMAGKICDLSRYHVWLAPFSERHLTKPVAKYPRLLLLIDLHYFREFQCSTYGYY